MFKKLKDKLAEEVKSSPQRIQQFAQAAQAAVTSASSSISDITNTDLFSIGDNDNPQNQLVKAETSTPNKKNAFQDVSLIQPVPLEPVLNSMDYVSSHEDRRERRLSNSSFSSDVSFRLPSYESPSSMYHLQSDMEVSASEADERGFSGSAVSLDRVTKEQIYAAYRRTQERYTKYRTQYADLARHYKLLERENSKAKSVLVETQDKALRRISELREQCALEQSAKAHLEKALRIEIEERNMKIETLNTKVQLLQSSNQNNENGNEVVENKIEPEIPLINLSDDDSKTKNVESLTAEINLMNNKIEKLEHLVNKYKDSLKTTKEKNSQLGTELQMLTSDVENKAKEIVKLQNTSERLNEATKKIQELNDQNEELQNKINAYDFNKTKELSTLEVDLQKAQEEIEQLHSKIQVFIKREEEYAISLAENKLSIHKELESKESEIKSLKDSLSASRKEIQSLNIVLSDYKINISNMEQESLKLSNEIKELNTSKNKVNDLELQLKEFTTKCQNLENLKTKSEEEFKCLQLQLKQETAEKLAMIDRNSYLENRNAQLTEDNSKKSLHITNLDKEIVLLRKNNSEEIEEAEKQKLMDEISLWKNKYTSLETNVQEEREELIKLQSEIEKLLSNYELTQLRNTELNNIISDLKSENKLKQTLEDTIKIKDDQYKNILHRVSNVKQSIDHISQDIKMFKQMNNEEIAVFKEKLIATLSNLALNNDLEIENLRNDHSACESKLSQTTTELVQVTNNLEILRNEYTELQSAIKAKTSENAILSEKIQDLLSIKEDHQNVSEKLIHIESKHQELKSLAENDKQRISSIGKKADLLEKEKYELLQKIDCFASERSDFNKEIENLKNRYEDLNTTCILLKRENEDLLTKRDELIKNKEDLITKYDNLSAEKETFAKTLSALEDEKSMLRNELDSLKHQFDDTLSKYDACKNEHEDLKIKASNLNKIEEELTFTIKALEEEKNELQKEIVNFKMLCENANVEITKLRVEKELLTKTNNLIKNEEELRVKHEEKDLLQKQNNELLTELNQLKKQNDDFINKTTEIDVERNFCIATLEEKVHNLNKENISLKSQSEQITTNIKELETELIDVRNSHAQMVREKDLLNAVIEKLEQKEQHRIDTVTDNETQTDELSSQVYSNLDNVLETEMKRVHVAKQTEQVNMNDEQDITDKFNTLTEECNKQKEENRRLQSDIAGLQTYLAQISKENSVLNDKLRELISSSENSDKNETASHYLTELKNEIQVDKSKIDELMRENTLLIDENLELKDQLNSQHYVPVKTTSSNDNVGDINSLKEKYNNLLETKHRFEKRMSELEELNSSVNKNMALMQNNNDKLKLTNEKLERRLDEALVSLRHLHSLQENTELEYLRNILYEYLTGSGTHSVTLAKVLAAVVKFDDKQTQQVLNKEKERQGLLRQLGLL